jgi:hypothetical protein
MTSGFSVSFPTAVTTLNVAPRTIATAGFTVDFSRVP